MLLPVVFSSCGERVVTEAVDSGVEVTEPTKSELAMKQARAIVTDPSNWKSHAEKITLLGEYAQDLGIANSTEYTNFDRDAQRLMEFGTTMITNMDEASVDRLRGQLIRITDNSNAKVRARTVTPTVAGNGTITIESERETEGVSIDEEVERIVYTSIDGLRASDAAVFGKLFSNAQESYRALRILLQRTTNEASP